MAKTHNPVTAIRSSFSALVPDMAADYETHIHQRIDKLEAKFGNVAAIPRQDRSLGVGSEVMTFMETGKAVSSPRAPLHRNAEKIAAFARQNAEDVVESFVRKLEGKLGDLDTVSMVNNRGAGFALYGRLGDRSVSVYQRAVLKVSSRGKLYHQFPARIYVDGKFTTEAEFKALAAKVAA